MSCTATCPLTICASSILLSSFVSLGFLSTGYDQPMMAALFSPTDQLSEDALLKHYLDKEGDDDEAFVAKDTQKERDRIWTAWLAYVEPCGLETHPRRMC